MAYGSVVQSAATTSPPSFQFADGGIGPTTDNTNLNGPVLAQAVYSKYGFYSATLSLASGVRSISHWVITMGLKVDARLGG
ncbi:uncharacterized protein LOC62_06G008812 [Vanrija pseudolonga]|uniref:Uncharacterized protein n=1 Tax=Vanrija pseudolonga TaxID=143232 RepID=A0AAF0YIM1_9TREE|nr:hypothetical protein LOC62_06G008812 [Vanrija pseudolonga]